MSCYDYGVYTPTSRTLVGLGARSVQVWGADDALQYYRDELDSSGDCVAVKSEFDDCVGPFECYTDTYAQSGTSLARPTAGFVNWTNPGSPTEGNSNYGVTIKVVEFLYPGFIPVNRGKLDLAAVITVLGTCPGPTASYTYEANDQFTGTWPIVVVGNPQPGDCIGYSIQIAPYEGALVPAEGYVDCGGGDAVLYGSSPAYPDDIGFTLNYNTLSGFTDTEEMWCCVSEGYGCCASPSAFFGGRFLIPPPTNPQPGEEGITTPLLYTPIYLSNHTFQFINNYGRVK